MLADGVGDRQQGPPTLVHPAGAGRRPVQSAVRRVRQSLHRPARRDAVLPADAVDPVASASDRNAHHAKRFSPRASCWSSRISGRCWCSTPTKASSSARRWIWSAASIRPTPPADWPIANRCGQRCPVAAAPAFSSATGIVVVSLWEPNAAAPVLVGLRYRAGQTPLLTREWTSDAVGQGPICQPGAVRRRVDRVRQRPRRTPVGAQHRGRQAEMVGAAGLSGADAAVGVARRPDRGGRRSWSQAGRGPRRRRPRATCCGPATTSSRCPRRAERGNGVGYTVAKDGENGQALLVFDPADGHTVNSYPLPQATGWPVGVSVGHDRRVVTATSDGQVYGFAPGVGATPTAEPRVARGTDASTGPADSANSSPWLKKKITRVVGQREVLVLGSGRARRWAGCRRSTPAASAAYCSTAG